MEKKHIPEIAPVGDWEAGVWRKDGEARRWEVALYQVVCHLLAFCILVDIFKILDDIFGLLHSDTGRWLSIRSYVTCTGILEAVFGILAGVFWITCLLF